MPDHAAVAEGGKCQLSVRAGGRSFIGAERSKPSSSGWRGGATDAEDCAQNPQRGPQGIDIVVA